MTKVEIQDAVTGAWVDQGDPFVGVHPEGWTDQGVPVSE